MFVDVEPNEDLGTVDIMNVKTLIDVAFGNEDENRVNFKLIQTVLFLLARQLRILDRRVAFEGPFAAIMENLSSLEVTEVKIHAMQPKKKGGKKGGDKGGDKGGEKVGEKGGDKGAGSGAGADKVSIGKPTKDRDKKDAYDKIKGAGKGSKKGKLEDYKKALEEYIDKQERELRVIHQRADSSEDPDVAPKPMKSIDTMEAQYEKLLVVERISPGSSRGSRSSRLSVVTQEEFMKLARTVRALQTHFGPIGTAGFPENAKLMESLRENASLTDAMAALQLSARLEAAEKVLGRMTQILSTVVKNTPGMTIDSETRMLLGAADLATDQDQEREIGTRGRGLQGTTDGTRPADIPEEGVVEESGEFVRPIDLDTAIKSLYNSVMANVRDITSQNTNNADQAYKIATNIENKLATSVNVGPRMAELESAVAAYTEEINALDTGLSSQMTNYQEQLTQMQHELEIGLDTMAEAMANTGGDTVAMAELNTSFVNLQMDFDNMTFRQKRVSDSLDNLKINIGNLWKQIEMLRDTKSDRDEVTDALRDKAGIKDLNGLVPLEQFHAVRGDFEKRIQDAYNKFNNQEIIWQKAIDELLRELSEKGDLVQLYSLKDNMLKHLEAITARMDAIAKIVGNPKTAITTKMLFRDSACICCSTPATMDFTKPDTIPALPGLRDGKKQSDSGEQDKKIGGGDTRPCYFGLPVLHSVDPRAHFCQRYCGGSHTRIPTGPPKVPPSFIITPVRKEENTQLGTDGKMYRVDEKSLKPCLPCNKDVPRDPPPPSPIPNEGPEEQETTMMSHNIEYVVHTSPANSATELTKEKTV